MHISKGRVITSEDCAMWMPKKIRSVRFERLLLTIPITYKVLADKQCYANHDSTAVAC